MKFKFKALAAAIALAAAAGSASAAIQPGTTAQGATGSELLFYAFDDVSKASFVLDLGVTYNSVTSSFAYGSAVSNNVSSNANWANYLTAVGGNTSNTYWGVFAYEKTSSLSANGENILTTARNNVTTTVTNASVKNVDSFFNTTYLGALADASAFGVNNSYFYDASNVSAANWANSGQHSLWGQTFLADNTIGTLANFYDVKLQTGTSALTSTVLSAASPNSTWMFDGNSVYVASVAAVPEPETYGMLAAGLLMLGAVARRRRA